MAKNSQGETGNNQTTYSQGIFSGLFSDFSKRSIIIGSIVTVLVLLTIAGIIYFYGFGESSEEYEVVAKVNGGKITEKKVMEIQESYSMSGEENYSKDDALENAVNMELLYQKAQNEGYGHTTQEIEKFLETNLAEQGTTLEEYKQEIEKQNTTYDEQIERYKEQATIQSYIEELSEEINVTEEEAREDYESYLEENPEAEESGELPEFEDIKEGVISELKERKKQELLQDLVNELRENATIEYY